MLRLGCVLLLLALPLSARADFEAGVAAAQAGDYAKALREWQPLADQGHRDAQFNLGLLYENGLGVAKDGEKAARWYRRAAEHGDRQAQAYLGEMYAQGLGVKRNDAEALRWYRTAAEHGHAASQYNVGLFYATGRGVPPDDIEGYAWLKVGQDNGAHQPAELLELLKKNMSASRLEAAEKLAEQVRQRCSLP